MAYPTAITEQYKEVSKELFYEKLMSDKRPNHHGCRWANDTKHWECWLTGTGKVLYIAKTISRTEEKFYLEKSLLN